MSFKRTKLSGSCNNQEKVDKAMTKKIVIRMMTDDDKV